MSSVPFSFFVSHSSLAVHIKKNQFNGINALGTEFKLSQFADDTAIFLKNKFEVPVIIRYIEAFTAVSGLKMNLEKSVLFPLKDCSLLQIEGIPVKHQITYLGVVICKNEKQRSQLNFDPIIEKTKKKLNLWLMRDISIFGRVLLSKTEGISRSVYISLSLEVPPKVKKIWTRYYMTLYGGKSHTILKKKLYVILESKGDLRF